MPQSPGPTVATNPQFLGRLVRARESSGLTQQALAERLDVHRVTIAKVESGASNPSQELLSRWCAELGFSLEITTNLRLKKIPKKSSQDP